jgi:hypothetical protein
MSSIPWINEKAPLFRAYLLKRSELRRLEMENWSPYPFDEPEEVQARAECVAFQQRLIQSCPRLFHFCTRLKKTIQPYLENPAYGPLWRAEGPDALAHYPFLLAHKKEFHWTWGVRVSAFYRQDRVSYGGCGFIVLHLNWQTGQFTWYSIPVQPNYNDFETKHSDSEDEALAGLARVLRSLPEVQCRQHRYHLAVARERGDTLEQFLAHVDPTHLSQRVGQELELDIMRTWPTG